MFIDAHAVEYPISVSCRVLKVSTSGFYKWRKVREICNSDDDKYKDLIRVLYKMSGDSYGARRITKSLRERGFIVNIKRIKRLMKELRIVGKGEPKKFIKTTDSNHDNPIFPNLVRRQFVVDNPNKIWVSDITYLWTDEGWVYLAVIIDLFSRMVVGWAMSKTIDNDLVCLALERAVVKRRPASGLVLHSDRGVQYASRKYRKLAESYRMFQSMSRKGNCWDNAVAESFFRSLKVERVSGMKILSVSHARQVISDYIDEFYNNNRIHSFLRYKTPVQWELEAQRDALLTL